MTYGCMGKEQVSKGQRGLVLVLTGVWAEGDGAREQLGSRGVQNVTWSRRVGASTSAR